MVAPMYDPTNEQALLRLESDIDAIYQTIKSSYDSVEEASEAALSTVRVLSQRWNHIPTRKALNFMETLEDLMEDEGLDRPAALQKLGEVRGEEFRLQGDPTLKFTLVERTSNGSVIRDDILSFSKPIVLRIEGNRDRKDLYEVTTRRQINHTGYPHSFLFSPGRTLEVSGLENGETMFLRIDPESYELIVERTR